MSTADEIAEAYQCPDCNAEKVLDRDPSGVWHLTVLHDDSCPWFNEREKGE